MRPHNPSEAARTKTVLIVFGPTAAGKSALALRLADSLEGTIINADSMQVYRDLSILTARPGPVELARAPHQLYGVLPGDTPCTAGLWRGLALEQIEAALAQGRRPILVGGTGLYLKALREGLAPVPEIPAVVRAATGEAYDKLGGEAFHARLAERDPEGAARLHPNDRQRLIRAWEVLEATGRRLADWQSGSADGGAPYRFATVVILPERVALYRRCDERFSDMLASGALQEVRALLARSYDPHLPVMKSLGVPELVAHLRSELSLEAAAEAARRKTRRYAKRQLTWLRHQILGNDRTVIPVETKESLTIDSDLFNKIRQKVLTLGA
jgi:tRNA dimethylallyltransferase